MKKDYDLLKVVCGKLDSLPTDTSASKNVYQYCKDNGIVVCFGESDDLMELRGAIYEEYGCYEGGVICVDENGWDANPKDYNPIIANWCKDEFPWTYELDAKHEEFYIYDDDEPYCKGIVFFVDDLKKKAPPMTNKEWLCSLNDEEFEKQVRWLYVSTSFCDAMGDKCIDFDGQCSSCRIAWLRAEHKEQ